MLSYCRLLMVFSLGLFVSVSPMAAAEGLITDISYPSGDFSDFNDGKPVGSVSFGYFQEPGGTRSGAELAIMSDISAYTSGRLSGVLYFGKNSEGVEDVFAGYSISLLFHTDFSHVNILSGVGIFLGESLVCDEDVDTDSEEECEKESIGAFFPELGVSIDLGGVRIYPYVRRYFDSKIHNKENRDAYGLQLGIHF
ncbi:hypothetical protein TOL_1451 [Thalassolituus oleivorans MIL-1]|uniref:Outer membrane protein beta-barrel domain-containing protein n=2 Tax=Thalassolituus oleivorans TaxID=187493 RepID=M5DR06_9GAMM|nr:hypothetical protein TOL_1451 [Thalassolituus oleivorans MIL-1]